MTSKSDALFWKKKEFVSFLLSILIFFIHSHFAKDVASGSLICAINYKTSYFFSRSITQFAVPMFFILSGITFFKDYNNKKYFAKIKSRFFTLVIPYLLWNTIWMLWEIFTSYSFLAKFSEDVSPFPLTLTNILKGIFFYGCNAPFWFIFDLIIFVFAAPLVFLIIKNKYVGVISAIFLSVASLFGIHLPINVFYYPTSIIFYLIGAIIGYHFFDFACKKASKPMQIASLIFLAAYILAKNIAPQEIHINNYLTQTIVYTLAAFCLWNALDIFTRRLKPRAIYRRSFAIYAMHLPVAIVILKILSFCTLQSQWLEIPKFIIMVVLTLVIINFVCAFMEKFAPKIYATLMGNRINKK
ncbi:MAG: acyltransferase [Oscillospiraceae bacterium]|nr:acyltransferase [Oscillospiraceae bacterium]